MLGSKGSHLEVIKELLRKEGLNLDCRDSDGNTVMHHACSGGNDKIVELLMACKVNLDPRNSENETPLVTAAKKGHGEIVRRLLLELPTTLAQDVITSTAAEDLG